MPRNRRPVDRAEKRSEIVTAATALFVDDGYDNTSMGRIAAAAGVTTNTIYWYFRDKDELLIGVLDEVHSETLTRFATLNQVPLGEQLLWAVGELERYHRLVDTVHARTSISPQIDEWHNRFHSTWEGWVSRELTRLGTPAADIEPMTRVSIFVVESMLTHPQTHREKRAILDLLFRTVGPPTPQ